MLWFRSIWESFRFAWNALGGNIMRTTLSFLGVTVGIFSIITVLTLVDALERNVKSSLSFLGANNIILAKWPYRFGDGSYPWWKYFRRPNPDYGEFKYLKKHLVNHAGITIYTYREGVTVKKGSNSSPHVNVLGVSYDYKNINDLQLSLGRYFSAQEMERAKYVALIGHTVAQDLFPHQSAIGQSIKLKGTRLKVIGVIKKEGETLMDIPGNDDNVIIPHQTLSKFYLTKARRGLGSSINIQGLPDDPGQKRLEEELIGLMRKKRGLRPKEKNNFALNRPEAIADFMAKVFGILHLAGWIMGSFSILVGGFGIANIMFVSVRERTPIIGIQKSLGAKNDFILYQFLFESVFLSLLGGSVGMSLVYLLTFVDLGALELILNLKNLLIGLSVSVGIGIVSGIAPAGFAARLNPVVAMRS